MTDITGDDGGPDASLTAALQAWQREPGVETDSGVHASLVGARLLVPIVPLPDDGSGQHEMSRPTLMGADGRPAALAFTSAATMAQWRADARPVPAAGRDVLTAATEAEQAVVLDVAGPIAYALEGEALTRLAAGVVRLGDSNELSAEIADRPVEGGLSAVEEPRSAPPGLRAALAEALGRESLIAEAYLLAPERGPQESAVAVGLVLREDVTSQVLVGLVRRLADVLGPSPAVGAGLDIAVLTDSQRAAALRLGPPAYVASGPT